MKMWNQAWKSYLSATVPQPPSRGLNVRSSRSCSPKVNATVPLPADDNRSVPAMSASPPPPPRARPEERRAPGQPQGSRAASGAASRGQGAAPHALLTATGRPCSGPSAASRRGAEAGAADAGAVAGAGAGAAAGAGAGGCRCLPARLALAWMQRWCRAKVCWRSSSRRSGDTAS